MAYAYQYVLALHTAPDTFKVLLESDALTDVSAWLWAEKCSEEEDTELLENGVVKLADGRVLRLLEGVKIPKSILEEEGEPHATD